jgi:2-aminophenol/2-amino-5-chlorophenol 1,6-dioxygenase subunit alpha
MLIQKAYLVPGQPHVLLASEKNTGWASLKASYEAIGREIERSGAELLLVYSTQWFSVIGHLMQVDPSPKWLLVDPNWYELGEIPYEFRIDPVFGELYCSLARQGGLQAATVNYHGFPIDTGTVVALRLLNPQNAIPASVVSCNIYAERDETRALGRIARQAIDAYGKKTVVVVVTNLSNRYEVGEIDVANDHISSAKDDEWNRKILEMLGEGRLEDVAQVAREFGREANADMGFKAIWWLAALAGEHNRYDGKVWDYQPVWGTGSALVELTPNPRKALDFEKEFDEGPGVLVGDAAGDQQEGTGLQTHNVLAEAPSAPSPRDLESQDGGEPPLPEWLSAVQGRGEPAQRRDGPPATTAAWAPPAALAQDAGSAIRTDKAPPPVGPYPHARRVGDLLFLSGIGPRKPGTGEIPGILRDEAGSVIDHDIEIQTRAAIGNVRAILEEAGSSLTKVLDVTVYLIDMKRDFARFNEVYAEYFEQIQPTRTTVGVEELPTPIAIELKVIAAA